MSRLIYHAREPLYSNVTVVAWWLQSQVHKIVCLAVNKDNIFVINSEYDQEISQSQTRNNPMAPRGRATHPSRDTRKTY